MKNMRFFLSENFPFLVVKFSLYLNRRVFVMCFLAAFGDKVKNNLIKVSNVVRG